MEKQKRKKKGVVVHLDKTLTVQNAMTLKEQFKSAIAKGDSIIIDHSGIEEFDVTYLQLLLSLDRYANEIGKKIRFTGSHPESFKNLIQNAGLKPDHWVCEPSDASSEDKGPENE